MSTPPFHPYHLKLVGDRVKIPRFPTDESQGYYYGTVIHGCLTINGFMPGGPMLIVEWDEPVPYLGHYSETIVAISDMPDPVWNSVETWKDAQAIFA